MMLLKLSLKNFWNLPLFEVVTDRPFCFDGEGLILLQLISLINVVE